MNFREMAEESKPSQSLIPGGNNIDMSLVVEASINDADCTGLQQALVSERFVRNWSEYQAPTSSWDCLEKEKRYDVDRKDSS
jgi:hypothetical protein